MRHAVLIFTSIFIVKLSIPSNAVVIHVPEDYATIQEAIDASTDGDTVLVAPDLYYEHIDFNGKDIVVSGEEGAETTIIEAYESGIPIVRFVNQETPDAVLSGFTLRLSQNASAIDILDSAPSIRNNIILVNGRGGIKVENEAFPEIKDNIFVNNNSPGGGAVYCSSADVVLVGNRFISNSAANYGGAVYLLQSDGSVIHHNLFYQNHSQSFGGAICLVDCSAIDIHNNTIAFNSTDQTNHGGGIVIWDSQTCEVYNNIITSNFGEGIYREGGFSSTATYNDVWDNTIDYHGIDPGQGSISENPLFVGGIPYSFDLTPDSPCIDAGDPDSPFDPDGSVADMGAFSYSHGPGPSLDIGDVAGGPGLSVDLPVLCFGLESMDISGLEFHISYDDSRLEYVDCSSGYIEDFLVNVDGGYIHLVWEDYLNPVNIPDSSAVLEFQFIINGAFGDSCFVNWSDGNEVVDTFGNIVSGLGFIDGVVFVEEILDVLDAHNHIPSNYYLGQNYPNPFNGTTTIEYGLVDNSRVTLEIFDIQGRKIASLVHDTYPAGLYRVTWNAGECSSGTYLYRIEIDNDSKVGKMSLVK